MTDNSSIKTQRAAKAFTRRMLMKTTVATGAIAIASPAIVRDAFSSSGEIDILMWSDYLPEGFVKSFTNDTGIKLNFTGIGSNEEIINKMKATQGTGFDLCSPTNMKGAIWSDLGLLKPFDAKKLANLGNVNPPMIAIGDNEWNFGGKGSHWLPHIWGTEGMGWRTDKWAPADGEPSYGDVWDKANAGKTMMRAHSGMLGAGLYLERIGKMKPGSTLVDAYQSEEKFRVVWDQITKFCIENKGNLKLLWDDADTQKNGLLNEGVIVGQTWDGPPIAMKNSGEPITYQAPKEGAMAWVDGMSMPTGAKNIDQIYAFIDYCYKPEPAGKAIDDHGYNSVVLGADGFAGQAYKKNFAEAYPGSALGNLNPWPAEQTWYADVRSEYVNKFKTA
ncbi:MAG: extracellular solute-binding protein [Rhodospirillales bacterium]